MKLTIADVARKCGVSVATVSRVMNGNYPVKAETKAKVLKTIKELNYIPSMQAKEFTKQKSTTIGVIVPSINNMFFTDVVNSIEKYLKEHGYSIILCCSNGNEEDEISSVQNLISRNVSGIIIVTPNTNNVKSGFYDGISNQIPITFINGYNNISNISSVSNDEKEGALISLNYLLENNHKNILFIRGENSYSYDIKETAYIEFMNDINNFSYKNIINIGEGNIIETVDNTTNKLIHILNDRKDITAIFTCNDLMALGVINACKKLNLDVPKDISVIGYDNILLSKLIEPKLTTIDQNMALLGSNASMLLLEKINCNNEFSKRIILNNHIVKRETVCKV